MASSSDTRSTCIWLEDTHVALLKKGSAQANNPRILFVKALDSRNTRGYDYLVFRTTVAEGKKPRAVTYYQGVWHELLHDKHTGKPYLGEPREDIHDHDGDTDPPSKSEDEADKSDSASETRSFTDKGKQQAESSSEDETNKQICHSPVIIQPLLEVSPHSPVIIQPLLKVSPLQETCQTTSPLCHKGPSIPILLSPATQRSSIATFKVQQPLLISTNMATTTTTATTMVQPSIQTTLARTTTPSATTADQRVHDRL